MIDQTQEQHDQQVIDELKRQTNRFTAIAFFVISLIIFSAWFYHEIEKWNWLDSFYYLIVTLGTVGYGDFTPKTDAGKLYAMALILVGIVTFGFFAQQLLKRQQLRVLERQIKRAKTKPQK